MVAHNALINGDGPIVEHEVSLRSAAKPRACP